MTSKNEKRDALPDFKENDSVYEANNQARFSKLQPRFRKVKVKNNKVAVVVTSKNTKAHKQKLKNKRKFQDHHNQRTETGNTGSNE